MGGVKVKINKKNLIAHKINIYTINSSYWNRKTSIVINNATQKFENITKNTIICSFLVICGFHELFYNL